MRSALRATIILGGSSIASAAISLVSAKVWAVLIGPAGVGYIAGLQNLLALGVMASGFGIGTGVVRFASKAVAEEDQAKVAGSWRAGLLLTLVFGLIGATLLFIFRERVTRLLFGEGLSGVSVGLISAGVLINVFTNFFIGYLNGHRRVKTLAFLTIAINVANAASIIGAIYFFGTDGIAAGIAVGLAIGCVMAVVLAKLRAPVAIAANWDQTRAAARELIRFGGPYTVSMLVGTGVQLAVPLIILSRIGAEAAGFYRAAAGISTMSLAFILAALGQDYYPRLSAISDDPEKTRATVNDQQWLVVVILAPIFLFLLLAAPILITLLYSDVFQPAEPLFKWIVAGDLFKSFGWILAYAALARSNTRAYFILEAISGLTMLAGVTVGINAFGLEGAGIGYFLSYVAYFVTGVVVISREVGLAYDAKNKIMMASAAGVIVIANLLGIYGRHQVRNVLLAAALVATVAICGYVLARQGDALGRMRRLRFWKGNR